MKNALGSGFTAYLLVSLAAGPWAWAQTQPTQTQPAPVQPPPTTTEPAAPTPGAPPAPGAPSPVPAEIAGNSGSSGAGGAPGNTTAPSPGTTTPPSPGTAGPPPSPGAPPAPGSAPPAPSLPSTPPSVSPPVVLPPSTSPPAADINDATSRRRLGDTFRSSVRRTPPRRDPATAPGRPAAARPASAPRTTEPAGTVSIPSGAPPAGTGAPSVSLQTAGEGLGDLPGEKEFNQCRKLPAGKRILKFNFKPDSEITDLIGWISTISCTQFLISGQTLAGKKVTVLSPQLITPEEAYRLFLGALESVGLTVEPMGRFLRIIETGRARFSNMPFYKDGEQIHGDKRYVTRLFRFEHLDSNDVLNGLYNQVRGEQGVGVAYQGSLIVTDQAMMIQRFEEIVRELDVASTIKEKIWMVRVKNTSATEMAGRLAEIFSVQQMGMGGSRRAGAGGTVPPAPPPAPPGQGANRPQVKRPDLASQLTITKLIPDERSNQLIVVANEGAYEWLLTILKKLDVPIEGGGDGRFHIYYCANANCDELAATLAAVTGVSVVGGGTSARRNARTAVPGAAPPPVAAPTGGAGGPNQSPPQLFEGDVRVTFDPATNSLVVYSSLKDFQSLRRVIDKLDAPRKQIYVEAMIMEVLLNKTRDVGVSYHGGLPITQGVGGDKILLGGFNAGKTLQPQAIAGDLMGLAGALFGPALDSAATRIFGTNVDIPSFGAFVKILQSNNDVNVLSTPHLLITNNQEGEISVGQRLPFPGSFGGGFGGLPGQQGGAAGLGGLFPQVSVNREDVSLRMKLIPSVNEHNMIRLEVDVEVSDLLAPNFNNLGPATSKRTAKTPVYCKDQQTVVIGGLMADRVSDTVQKVPILGDIPVLGFFFRQTKKEMQKSNIIIALTPYVIDDMDDLRRVAEKKLRERREFIDRYSAAEDQAKLEGNIDYRRKRGMLEEINRTAREIDDEESALRRIRERDLMDESTPIELPGQERVTPPRAQQTPGNPSAPVPGPRPIRRQDLEDPAGPPAARPGAQLSAPAASRPVASRQPRRTPQRVRRPVTPPASPASPTSSALAAQGGR